MKVLFAVSNEEISEAIVKRYQKEYKEIISYKNVYYFNAILKEVQKEKSYDRIVISEELESNGKSQQVEVDNSIFDKLDSISDEAVDLDGKDIPIIVIASDRRRQSDVMITKLFGIGIYNALIGKSRSIEEVCKLIKKPRIKKEAKQYYSLDAEDVTYQAVSENDVREEEIQNILKYYQQLGNDEEKIVESFVSISAQYNANQLRVIGKFLPASVKDVLGRKSVKYQQVMGFGSSFAREDTKSKELKEEVNGTMGTLLKSDKKDKGITNVVIPTNVKLSKNKKLLEDEPIFETEKIMGEAKAAQPVIVKAKEPEIVKEILVEPEVEKTEISPAGIADDIEMPAPAAEIPEETEVAVPVKKGRGRPKKVVVETESIQQEVKKGRGRPKKVVEQPIIEPPVIEQLEPEIEMINSPSITEEDLFMDELLPGLEDSHEEPAVESKPKVEANIEEFVTSDSNEVITQQHLIEAFNNGITSDFVEIQKTVKPVEEPPAIEIEEISIPGLDDLFEENDEDEFVLPVIEEDISIPGLGEIEVPLEIETPSIEIPEIEEMILPIAEVEEEPIIEEKEQENDVNYELHEMRSVDLSYQYYEQEIDLTSLLMGNRKIVSFVGASKNGNSFLVNNVAKMLASKGVDVAILDATKNRSAYFIYTNNDESLRQIAATSIENLSRGNAEGIVAERNLTVYTSTVEQSDDLIKVDRNLETLIKKHDVVLIDCDYETPFGYYKQSQEIYLVQSYDILTIQPFTVFLRILKEKEMLEESKIRIVLNKTIKIKGITDKTIIGGMAFYRDPAMSFMKELFDRNIVKYVSVPFDKDVYVKYLEGVINCNITQKGYPKLFLNTLNQLSEMIYSTSRNNTNLPANVSKRKNQFTNNMDNTLNQMKQNY